MVALSTPLTEVAMKRKVSLQEKLRREKQSRRTRGLSSTFWDEDNQVTTMTKTKDGYWSVSVKGKSS